MSRNAGREKRSQERIRRYIGPLVQDNATLWLDMSINGPMIGFIQDSKLTRIDMMYNTEIWKSEKLRYHLLLEQSVVRDVAAENGLEANVLSEFKSRGIELSGGIYDPMYVEFSNEEAKMYDVVRPRSEPITLRRNVVAATQNQRDRNYLQHLRAYDVSFGNTDVALNIHSTISRAKLRKKKTTKQSIVYFNNSVPVGGFMNQANILQKNKYTALQQSNILEQLKQNSLVEHIVDRETNCINRKGKEKVASEDIIFYNDEEYWNKGKCYKDVYLSKAYLKSVSLETLKYIYNLSLRYYEPHHIFENMEQLLCLEIPYRKLPEKGNLAFDAR